MDIITIGLIALGAKMLMNKKEDDQIETITHPSIEAPKPGEPRLTIDKIRKILNRVDYSFSDGKVGQEFKHKWKSKDITEGKVGKFTVRAITTMEKNKRGNEDWGPVMITVMDGNKVKLAKRVLVNEGKVIDIL